MIFYFNATGVPLSYAPERIVQGSNNVSTAYFVCPIDPSSVVTANFVLPDETKITRLMTLVSQPDLLEGQENIVSIWKLSINDAITSQVGLVEVSFSVKGKESSFNTVVTAITVEEGVPPTMPSQEDLAKDINEFILSINESYLNIIERLEGMPTKLSDLTDDIRVAKKDSNNNFNTSQTVTGDFTVSGEITSNGKKFSDKQDKLTAGENITIDSDNVISANIFVNIPKSWEEVKNVVRQGHAEKVFSVADQFETERTTNISVSIGDSTGITSVTYNAVKTMQKASETDKDIIELVYNGSIWHTESNQGISLSDWGLNVVGKPVETDKITITKTASNIAWDILGFNQCVPQDTSLKNALVLGAHNIISHGLINFCAPQLMYYTANGLSAGKYKFTLDHATYTGALGYEGTYMFELAQDIPAGGGFSHKGIGFYSSSYTQAHVIGNHITTYNPVTETSAGDIVEKNVAVSLYDGSQAIDLGTFTSKKEYYVEDDEINVGGKRNSVEKQIYGSNSWKNSAMRQWLNSSAPPVPEGSDKVSNWWTPQSVFDRVPLGAKRAGFLYGLEADFVSALKEVEVKTAVTNFDKTADKTFDITYDKVWLQSKKNVLNLNNNNVAEGVQFDYWKNSTNSDRVKYFGSTAKSWFLRSALETVSFLSEGIKVTGAYDNIYACAEYGIVPACCIV